MCGIVGFFKKKGSSDYKINDLLDSIKHRGPDAQTFYEDESIVLGHVRLSIVDIENGNQPFYHKNYILIFNGEIYNHKAIRKELISQGVKFDTDSDTEVLLKAFIFYGNDFVDYLQGMYSFVIYDKISKQVLLARDFFGIKPLYVYKSNKDFQFSSEMSTLIKSLKENNIKFKLSSKAQIEYLKNDFIENNNIVQDSFELKKGHLYKYENGELTIEKKIDYKFDIKECNLEELLTSELKNQLDADVDVGVLLSGGIDSSLITALSSEIKPNLRTYSVSFDNGNIYDESEFAKLVANKFNTNHKEFKFTEDILISYLPILIDIIDIPIYDPAMLPMLFLSENVAKETKVVLSGDGGDELFSGYTHHRILKYKDLFSFLSSMLDVLKIKKNLSLIIKQTLKKHKNLRNALKYDVNVGLNNRLLRKTDLCSMRFGLEVRVPFLSKRIFNYANSKNPSSYVNLKFGKLPLRKLVSKKISNKIAYKKKQGFRVPIREWVSNGKLKSIIENDLRNNNYITEDVLSKEKLNRYLNSKPLYYKELFALYILNNWLKKVYS